MWLQIPYWFTTRNFCHKIFQLNDSILSSLSLLREEALTATFELVDKNNSELLPLVTDTNFTIFQLMIVRFFITAVIKNRGAQISPGYYKRCPQVPFIGNLKKSKPKRNPWLFVVFTWQLKILVTTLLMLKVEGT